MPGGDLGADLAEWLRLALIGPDGRPKMTDNKVIEKSGVGRGTFYDIKGGKGAETGEETIKKLARALGVPVPRVDRRLTFDLPQTPETPRALLRRAQDLLRRLEGMLPTSPEEGVPVDEEVAHASKHIEAAREAVRGATRRPGRAG